jgi:hypothetical protein
MATMKARAHAGRSIVSAPAAVALDARAGAAFN